MAKKKKKEQEPESIFLDKNIKIWVKTKTVDEIYNGWKEWTEKKNIKRNPQNYREYLYEEVEKLKKTNPELF